MSTVHDHPEPSHPSVPQDGFRRVILGQASDPLFPPHPGPPEVPEDDLTRAALEDTFHLRRRRKWGFSPLWPVLGLAAVALLVLGVVLRVRA